MSRGTYLLLIVITAIVSCKKPYNPPATSAPNNFLVVEGVINSGADSTFIKLHRTVNLDSNVTGKPELNAAVAVEGDQNTSYPLTAVGNGVYACAGLNLDNAHQYRLSIKTANNEQYLSAYIPVLNSPPIDSISYDTKGALTVPGLNIYVDTHDPTGKVLYYRWEYQETWIFHSNYPSGFYSNGDTVLLRNQTTDNITNCWGNDTSSSITLGSAAKLSEDIIAHMPLTSIVSTSEKVEDSYSILVKQYALTPDAYNFYTNLKKNTEDLGSIFDAQPSQINGNITCVTNPAEPVIGYISAGSTTSKRLFVFSQQLPKWVTIPFYTNCKLEFDWTPPKPEICCYYDAPNTGENEVNDFINYLISGNPNPYIPVSTLLEFGDHGPIIGYTATTRPCADCTLRGTNKKPGFWP
jgi:hypothetical protein